MCLNNVFSRNILYYTIYTSLKYIFVYTEGFTVFVFNNCFSVNYFCNMVVGKTYFIRHLQSLKFVINVGPSELKIKQFKLCIRIF